MDCPICGHKLPKPDDRVMVKRLTVCQNPDCARTLCIKDKQAHAACAEDVQALDALEQATLRKSRPPVWREKVKARLGEIRGKAR